MLVLQSLFFHHVILIIPRWKEPFRSITSTGKYCRQIIAHRCDNLTAKETIHINGDKFVTDVIHRNQMEWEKKRLGPCGNIAQNRPERRNGEKQLLS